MNIDQLSWISGLDRTGWIAVALFAVFFIIVIFTILMMLKLNRENKKDKQKPLKESQPAASKSARPAPAKAKAKNTENKNDASNPLEEAKVFITYGLNKQAADLLEKHLEKNPSDKAAIEMLAKAKAGMQ